MLDSALDANLREKISAVSAAHPELYAYGLQHRARGRLAYNDADKAFMDTPDFRWQVHTAMQFIAMRRARTTLNRKISSYGWKHKAERWGRSAGLSSYVSNGAMIVAAHLCGVRVEAPNQNTPNPYLALGGNL